ncbi:interleukin-17A-like [Xyrichtys novacula]|uniref:Interleukin-17A-like n=1 Tax=Xyrichtys novacula TaxID=13765 RepID=A0AAV1GZ32_XYRNO|nr:interleukin-17A-like [Xyrichtys novacula]
MLLVLRASFLLSLVMLLHAAKKDQAVMRGQRTRQRARTLRLVLDPSVLSHISGMSASTIANMSLSPWTYRESREESRLPMQISHAECLTSGCLSLLGDGEDAALMAKPIYYQILVLRRVLKQKPKKTGRGKVKKRYVFRLGTEVVSVGCTCVRPSLVPQP